jgi:hypothetical protein
MFMIIMLILLFGICLLLFRNLPVALIATAVLAAVIGFWIPAIIGL